MRLFACFFFIVLLIITTGEMLKTRYLHERNGRWYQREFISLESYDSRSIEMYELPLAWWHYWALGDRARMTDWDRLRDRYVAGKTIR